MKNSAALSFVLGMLGLSGAGAVQVLTTTGNVTAPPDDPGFANVGTLNGASVVYLGDRWVLTASHVGTGTVVLGGNSYTQVGSVTQMNNQGTPGMSAFTDLIMFQINADPGLPSLMISPAVPALADDVVMIGNGVNRAAGRSYYTVVQGPGPADDVWTPAGGPGAGVTEIFQSASGSAVRWGTNDVEGVALNFNTPSGTVRSFATIFDDDPAGRPNEAQGVVGDSGSAVFRKTGPTWELLGIAYAVGNLNGFDNIPGGAFSSIPDSSFTAIADLSFYRNQILILIPEPGTAWLAILGLLGHLRRHRG